MMKQYEVVKQCYVPIGPDGQKKFKQPGHVVTLKAADAKKLADYVKPVGGSDSDPLPEPVVEPVVAPIAVLPDDTPLKTPVFPPVVAPKEVTSDAGESQSADERASDKAPE